jgi:RNA polymerase sigma-70 factor (ECF subfamily)
MMTESPKYPEVVLTAFLLSSLRAGDGRAAAQLVRLRAPRLLAHAVRLLDDPEGARDVMQDAWLDIFRGIQGLKDDHAFMPWALSIVSRKVARLIAGRVKARRLAAAVAAEPDQMVVSGHAGPEAADAARVRAALATLSPEHRATVALFYLEDLSVAEVATALGVPRGTVKTRLMHARARLRAELEGENHGKD